jgi:beta-glucosidase
MKHARALVSALALTASVATSSCTPTPAATQGFRTVTFPSTFAWGTAIAGWQNEGDEGKDGHVVDSNWSRWAKLGKTKGAQQNPKGNGFYTGFAADIQCAKDLGLDSFRLSADWSRIEPQPGVFDDDELRHLDDVLDAIVAAHMKPILTLWHWTVPVWVQNPDPSVPGGVVDLIGTKDRAVVDEFEKFVRVVIPRVKDRVDTYTVLNEPMSMIVAGYFQGSFPPGVVLDLGTATDFGINLMFMHARAYDVIKELDDTDADGDGVNSFVGITMAANEIYPEDPTNPDQVFSAQSISYIFNDWIVQALTSGQLDVNLDGEVNDLTTSPPEQTYAELANRLEFIGVQYYGPVRTVDNALFKNFAPLFGQPELDTDAYSDVKLHALPHNGMGREITASGYRDTITRYAKWHLPLIMTENGTTTNTRPIDPAAGSNVIATPTFDDDQAAMYLVEHLWELGRAVQRGVDIRGYDHWTLADNFEWVEGRQQHFGAYTVDFNDPTLPRTLNKMGEALRDVVQAKGVTEAIYKKYVLAKYPTDTRADATITTSEPVVGPLP